ncbi:hypothetical protein EYV94_01460 [Puteibacter caeruleilacunae]|nr:hypothetical protein EYV94_01460 [Puteibacter caeruleilacunae]
MRNLKMIVGSIALVLIMASASFASKNNVELTGESPTSFGKYTIQATGNTVFINGKEMKTYDMVYENARHQFQIAVEKTKKCRNFIVRTEDFEIRYMCDKGVFGVTKVPRKYRSIDEAYTDRHLDTKSFANQKVLTQKPKTEEELLGLIACYFPMLLKDEARRVF